MDLCYLQPHNPSRIKIVALSYVNEASSKMVANHEQDDLPNQSQTKAALKL